MGTLIIDPQSVLGWGVDADTRNDPTYPYRVRENDDRRGPMEGARPPMQSQSIEVLQSIEHVRRPAVFGTSTPPSGASGVIRRAAFGWSESNWLHWLLLMGADRVNVVEGLVEDLGRGKVPNVLGEMGVRATWEHDRNGLTTKLVVTAAVVGGAVLLIRRRKRRQTGRRGAAMVAFSARETRQSD
jgi:hypothetical protein